MSGFVYFIGEAPYAELVKVGWTTNVQKRLGELQCGNPRELWLLGYARAPRVEEYRAHNRLASYRDRGEWFRLPHPHAIWPAQHQGGGIEELVDAAINGDREPVAA